MSTDSRRSEEMIVSAAVEDAVNAMVPINDGLLALSAVPANFPNSKKGGKNIDWNAPRELQLVQLVIKHNAYKKTEKTMEEKWANLSHDLFSLDIFKTLQPLDGYTLQKKFLRLKKKVAMKFELDEENPQNNVAQVVALQNEMDNTERLLCKIFTEGVSGYRRASQSGGTASAVAVEEEAETMPEEYASYLSTSAAEVAAEISSRSHINPQDVQTLIGTGLTANSEVSMASVPASTNSLLSGHLMSGHKHKLSFEYAFFEFEKEKERKRIAHEQEMEKVRMIAENEQQSKRLELELKRAEIESKQAEAMKAQSQLTYELLMEVKKLRQQINTPNSSSSNENS